MTYSKCSTCINLCRSHNHPVTWVLLLSPVYIWGNGGPERLSKIPKVTQLKLRCKPRLVWTQRPGCPGTAHTHTTASLLGLKKWEPGGLSISVEPLVHLTLLCAGAGRSLSHQQSPASIFPVIFKGQDTWDWLSSVSETPSQFSCRPRQSRGG